jgi:hypothetical protein
MRVKSFAQYLLEKAGSDEIGGTWTDVRDAIQLKKPFVIVVFRTRSSYSEAIETEFKETQYVKQTAVFTVDGDKIKYPSIFFVLDRDMDFRTRVKELYEKFDIKQLILGKPNAEYSTLYAKDGTSSDFGNEIVSTLEPSEFKSDSHFKIGSHYYRFVEFEG